MDLPILRWKWVTLLVNKYLDHLYTGIITRAVKEPIAELAYRSNQAVLDRTVDTFGRSAVKIGQLNYFKIDQNVVDGFVNASGRISSESGEELRKFNPEKFRVMQQFCLLLRRF